MRSEDRKRSTQRSYGNGERPSRVHGGRRRDAGASEQYSGVIYAKGRREENGRAGAAASSSSDPFDDVDEVPAGQADRANDRTRARPPDVAPASPSGTDSSGHADVGREPDADWYNDPNIVPENERSQR
jgi:hypothetical protein